MSRLMARLGCALVWGLAACTLTPTPSPVELPSENQAPASTPAPTSTPFDSGWVARTPGFDRREMEVPIPALGVAERVVVFRIEPAAHNFRVQYTPGFSRRVSEWGAATALLVFNGGFFDEHDMAIALVVTNGRVFGQSYVDFGGMFAVVDGVPSVRSLVAQPHQPGERLDQAVQGFPMLIYPDGTAFAREDGARARRTALGQDAEGRIYVILAPRTALTLAELAAWMRASDLDLIIALNLDGGGSTGYDAGPSDRVDSLTPVPSVVVVEARP